MIFGRTGLLPGKLGQVRFRSETPVNALLFMTVAGLGIIGAWWVLRLITGDTGSMNPVGLYAECSTMATIVILFVYFLTMVSLPVFMWRRHRDSFSPFRHVAIPALGSLTLIVPFVELCQPGQPAPYSAFPLIACVVVHRTRAPEQVRERPSPEAEQGWRWAGQPYAGHGAHAARSPRQRNMASP